MSLKFFCLMQVHDLNTAATWQRRDIILRDGRQKVMVKLWGDAARDDYRVGERLKLLTMVTDKNEKYNFNRAFLSTTDETVIEVRKQQRTHVIS